MQSPYSDTGILSFIKDFFDNQNLWNVVMKIVLKEKSQNNNILHELLNIFENFPNCSQLPPVSSQQSKIVNPDFNPYIIF